MLDTCRRPTSDGFLMVVDTCKNSITGGFKTFSGWARGPEATFGTLTCGMATRLKLDKKPFRHILKVGESDGRQLPKVTRCPQMNASLRQLSSAYIRLVENGLRVSLE